MNKRGSLIGWYIFIVVILALLVFLYLTTEAEIIRLLTLAVIVLVIFLALCFVYLEYFSASTKLRKKIKKFLLRLPHEPAGILKNEYLNIYHLYIKVAEKRKKEFYEVINKIREQVEEYLVAEKKILEKFHSLGKTIKQRKKSYLDIHALYQKLPSKVQEKYYHLIVDLKQKLEGRK